MTIESANETPEAAEAPGSAKEPTVADVASVIANMNRFLSIFSQHPVFKNAKLGLAEWLVLEMLSQKSAEDSKSLIKELGLSAQRLKQILEQLRSADLVTLAGDKPQDAVVLTEQGQTSVDMVAAALQPQISERFKGRERLVPAVDKGLKMLYRAALPARDR